MALTEQQAQAAHYPGSVAVTAGAGTGKTHMLVERYLYFLSQGISPLNIVAVTFTNKAAQELRSRIRRRITATMGDRFDLLAELEAAPISTIHALAQQICRDHPEAADVPPDFTVQETLLAPVWFEAVLLEAIAQLPPPLVLPFSRLQPLLRAMLQNPSTAAAALECDRTAWLPLLAQLRQDRLTALISAAQWQQDKQVLIAYAAAPSDKLEGHRRTALEAIADLEAGRNLAGAIAALQTIKINVGSAKNWGDKETLATVKDALKSLRSQAQTEGDQGILTLEPNAIDDRTEALLPEIRAAFIAVQAAIYRAKTEQRILDFNDLELRALQALHDPAVQDYYAQRFKVFLIDEFQDTNPIQGQLLDRLTPQATVTIVGDGKQAIYGFRDADVRVFHAWQHRIHGRDRPLELSLSFRTHTALLTQINQVFAPILGDLHQSLTAQRQTPLTPTPQIQLYTVQPAEGQTADVTARRRVEAAKIAALVAEMVGQPWIQDKASGAARPIEYRDIAILARTWESLTAPAAALAAQQIPSVRGKDGALLATREAKDGWALLQWLADPMDDLALAAVLRSPFFAVSDRTLYEFTQSLPEKTSWWRHLAQSTDPQLSAAYHGLQTLKAARRTDPPTRLLQLGDRLTGYTAILANLPDAERRLADWRGFREVVRSLELGNEDAIVVVRRLKQIAAAQVDVPRPALTVGNAVTLTTIHSAKGLEWPVVFVVDLSRQPSNNSDFYYFDAELGLGLKLEDDAGDRHPSALYTLLKHRQNQAETAEAKRLMYVALTRARDRLILTAAEPDQSTLNLLKPGLDTCVAAIALDYHPTAPAPVQPPTDPAPAAPIPTPLAPCPSAGFSELPITALTDYALCPLRFKFRYVDGHPGAYDGDSDPTARMKIGSLTHKALELDITDLDHLKPYGADLSEADRQDALHCAERFRHAPAFAAYRQGQREAWVQLECQGMLFNGYVDRLGDEFVLDFKTDRTLDPQHHRFQLWAYSRAAQKPHAHIAYLRHDHLHTFTPAELDNLDRPAHAMIEQLAQGNFTATPERDRCSRCPYFSCCDASSTTE